MENETLPTTTGGAPIAISWRGIAFNWMYIGFASAALLANLLIAFVLCRNKEFLKKSAFITGLAAGDTCYSIGAIVGGALRNKYVFQGTLFNQVHPSYCLKTITTWQLVGIQLPSMMIFFAGTERMLGVLCFSWYYINWTNKKAWLLTLTAGVFCLVSVTACWVIVYTVPDTPTVPFQCGTQTAVGRPYTNYHFTVAVLCGGWSIISTFIALSGFRKKKAKFAIENDPNMLQFVKKQLLITKWMTCIAICDFTMVVIPNTLMMLTIFMPDEIGLPVVTCATCLLCLKSMTSIIIYSFFNSDFRASFRNAFARNGQSTSSTSVQPILRKTN